MAEQTEFVCEVREVFSGDDLIAFVDLGVENLWKKQRIRLHGVDTPNAIKQPGDSEAGKIRSFVRNVARGRKGKITVISKTANVWVVVLCVATQDGEMNINEYLINQGYKFVKPETAQ